MNRKREFLSRFLPHNIQEDIFNPKLEEPHSENKEEEPFENSFVAT